MQTENFSPQPGMGQINPTAGAFMKFSRFKINFRCLTGMSSLLIRLLTDLHLSRTIVVGIGCSNGSRGRTGREDSSHHRRCLE